MKHQHARSGAATNAARRLYRQVICLMAAIIGGHTPPAMGNPEGAIVVSGQATTVTTGPNISITASQNAELNWTSFNIQPGETTTFIQPSATSVVWNRILDQNPSQILGNLNANGYVILFNQSGFYFGPKSVVNVGGLIVSTAPFRPMDYSGGGMWQFDGAPPSASIVNYGQVTTTKGGSIFLIAEKVDNHGVLMAPDGNIGLYADKEVLISDRPDGRGMSATVRLPQGSVDNHGKIIADAGTIALHAQVVNQGGLLQANSVRDHNGVIELYADSQVNLDEHSVIQAKGDNSSVSAGGHISVKSAAAYSDALGSQMDVSGSVLGGQGGSVGISATQLGEIRSTLNATAQPGFMGGSLTIDPTDIIIGNSGSGSAGTGTVDAQTGTGTLNLSVYSAFTGFSQISLQATRDISLAASTQWNLFNSTGNDSPDCKLTLQAGRNIVFGNNSGITASGEWSVDLVAGANFSSPTAVTPGVGGIYLGGSPTLKQNGFIQGERGNLRLFAGNEVLLGSGYIRTSGGGGIQITTESGDVNAGTKSQTYDYTRTGYQISSQGAGGIATTGGGDVTINAGRDVISSLPTIGALGEQPGNVTVNAGNRVTGNYLVRNGVGSIHAENGSVGSASAPLNLSLMRGSWTVEALNSDIYLNEVRNPNGVFNNTAIRGSFNGQAVTPEQQIAHLFDYALDASVTLRAGNSVQLLGSNLPRPNDALPPIYPPILDISAGAGGIVLGNEVQLYPSPLGKLSLKTTDGGSFQSLGNNFYQFVMSDSGDLHYSSFATDHAATPLHLNSADSVSVNIGGDVRNVFLRVPERATITIDGDVSNFSFEGQNLHPDDVTSIAIGGDLKNRNRLTTVTLESAPNLAIFDPAVAVNQLGSRVSYNAATGELTFQNKMSQPELDFLLNPVVRQFDEFGNPVLDAFGVQQTMPSVFSTDTAAINTLFRNSQNIPTSSLAYQGIQLGGQGFLNLSARNLDLGISQGIRSVGANLNPNLTPVAQASIPSGSAVKVDLTGDLDMTSSQIGSFGGAGIALTVGGKLNVGSQEQFTSDDVPKGIYTTSGGDINVSANGDINVNGSRIAAFDGGNITIRTATGDVNAGSGGLGIVVFSRDVLDPVTGVLGTVLVHVGISGIAATSFPGSGRVCGNILIEAARDILANYGGILQSAFLGGLSSGSRIALKAGRDIKAGLSGVVGENVSLDAGGNIDGLVVASANLSITSVQNVNVIAVAGTSASVSAGGDVGGRIASSGSINVDSKSVSADVISHNTTVSGDASKATVGVQATTSTHTEKVTETASETIAKAATSLDTQSKEEDKKNPRATAKLVRTVGRVTVILPKK